MRQFRIAEAASSVPTKTITPCQAHERAVQRIDSASAPAVTGTGAHAT